LLTSGSGVKALGGGVKLFTSVLARKARRPENQPSALD
jgi:hypothetical protein